MTLASAVVLSIGIGLLYLGLVAAALIVSAIRTGGRLEERLDDHDALSASRFTIPVSIVIAGPLDQTLRSTAVAALGLSYPELEVILVCDAPSPAALQTLEQAFQLEAREFFYRRSLDTSAVRRIYRSANEQRLTIIDKTQGTLADAFNCGVNLARYRYVLTLPAGVSFDADALLRLMSPAFRDPSTIVAVSSHIESGVSSETVSRLGAAERLVALRGLMTSRLVWAGLRRGLTADESVVVWRRDAVLNAGGFSATAADPVLDLMFRLQTVMADRSERVVRGRDIFGQRPADPAGSILARARRRQRASLQLMTALFRPRLRSLGARPVLAFLAAEVITPLVEGWIVLATIVAVAAGWLSWYAVPLVLIALGFGSAATTTAALLLRGSMAAAPGDTVLRQLLSDSAFEIVVAKPLRATGRLAGIGTFFTGALSGPVSKPSVQQE